MTKNNFNTGSNADLSQDTSPGYSPNSQQVRSNDIDMYSERRRPAEPGVLAKIKRVIVPFRPRVSFNPPQRQSRQQSAQELIDRPYRGVSERVRAGIQSVTPTAQAVKKGFYRKEVIYNRKGVPIGTRTRGLYPAMTHRIKHTRIAARPLVRRESANVVAKQITGKNLPMGQKTKGYGTRGRPKGSYYKYSIPGVGPVDVFTWRKYTRNQQRLLAMKMMQQNPEMSYPQARSAMAQVSRQMPMQIQQPTQMPQQQEIMQPQGYNQQIQPIQMSQQPAFDDGWGLLRIGSPFSQAPARPVEPTANVQPPVGNRNTAFYSEPNFFGGMVMKQRPNIGGFGLW